MNVMFVPLQEHLDLKEDPDHRDHRDSVVTREKEDLPDHLDKMVVQVCV